MERKKGTVKGQRSWERGRRKCKGTKERGGERGGGTPNASNSSFENKTEQEGLEKATKSSWIQREMKRERELRTRDVEDGRQKGKGQTSLPNPSAYGGESISLQSVKFQLNPNSQCWKQYQGLLMRNKIFFF